MRTTARPAAPSMLWLIPLAMILIAFAPGPSQATFSIAAVDPVTGEVGSAGASCISGSIILSDVHPGVGVVHTQAYWNAQNQTYARSLMNQGYSPEAIIDSLVAHDAQNNPTIRQYGIVDLVDGGRSAAYTGVNCSTWRGHLLGPTYAIQGNILLGPEIVADMETAFLGSPGWLGDRLMAALQAANVPGADTRCAGCGKPAISAFIRIGRPGNPASSLYLDLNVNNTICSENPIDILQELYDQWTVSTPEAGDMSARPLLGQNRPNPVAVSTTISYHLPRPERVVLRVYDAGGRLVVDLVEALQSAGEHTVRWDAGETPRGVYFYRLETASTTRVRKMVIVD